MFTTILFSLLVFTTVYSDVTDEVINDVDNDPDDDVVTDEEVADDEDENKINENGQQSISFSQPSLTEEEQKSQHFPDRYKCEACQIVVHNLGTDFKTAEEKVPKKKLKVGKDPLGDVQVLEIVDEVCSKDKFDSYSIQEFDGKVTFKGPAFPDRTAPGMSMGGGMWPVRYTNYCGSLFEDIEEDEAYEYYRKGELFSKICLKGHCKGVLDSTPETLVFKPVPKILKKPKQEL